MMKQVTLEEVSRGITELLTMEGRRKLDEVLKHMHSCVKRGKDAKSFAAYVSCVDSAPTSVRDISRTLTLQIVSSQLGKGLRWEELKDLASKGAISTLVLEAIYGVVKTAGGEKT